MQRGTRQTALERPPLARASKAKGRLSPSRPVEAALGPGGQEAVVPFAAGHVRNCSCAGRPRVRPAHGFPCVGVIPR
ncbi:hypothetical protein KSP40_PGU008852 [Platanthera guangdongensis]|uniref:Uncharacterized protein n=1 Tax=Platanthera guangdongensis TaxID=2320717 RepID=A0ABR2MT72_9ASPA